MADDIGIQQEMLIEPTHKKLEIIDGHAVKWKIIRIRNCSIKV